LQKKGDLLQVYHLSPIRGFLAFSLPELWIYSQSSERHILDQVHYSLVYILSMAITPKGTPKNNYFATVTAVWLTLPILSQKNRLSLKLKSKKIIDVDKIILQNKKEKTVAWCEISSERIEEKEMKPSIFLCKIYVICTKKLIET